MNTAHSLGAAASARTVLAAGAWATWAADGEEFQAPYFDNSGTPVLLVDRQTSTLLADAGYLSTTSYALPALGLLRLGGAPWPAAGDALASVCEFRRQHADCADCCGPRRSHLVGLRLHRVEFAAGGRADRAPDHAKAFETVDLDDFLAAKPDEIVTHSVRVRAHLNAEHREELRVLAARLLLMSEDDIAAATLEWIDANGIDLAVIGSEGARAFRFPFRRPLTSMDDLGGQLHRLLNQPGPYPC